MLAPAPRNPGVVYDRPDDHEAPWPVVVLLFIMMTIITSVIIGSILELVIAELIKLSQHF